jgi:serine/threonine-protein kinase
VKVVLVDDAWLVREGIARLLADEGIEVAAQLTDATDVLTTVRETAPDAVILDVRMPPTFTTEGLQAALALKQAFPAMGVLVLSQHVETRHAVELLSDGRTGVGYVLKHRITSPDELVGAVQTVADGGITIDPEVVRVVFESPRQADPLDRLTDREREVLRYVSEGRSNERIAELLGVNARTVETHTSRIFTKLDLEVDQGTHRRVLAVLAHLRASPDA